MDKLKKIKEEKEIIDFMISYYCKKKHKEKQLCKSCQELMEYAHSRIDKCPFMETKTFCSACKIHCYEKSMQIRIKEVMRYSGPRMIFHRPIKAIQHVLVERRKKQS